MHVITISFGPNSTQVPLHFDSVENAEAAMATVKSPGANAPGAVVEIVDDFGQKFRGALMHVHGLFLEDVDVATKLRAERWMSEQRAAVKAQSSLAKDPALRAMAQLNGGMNMMPPGGIMRS